MLSKQRRGVSMNSPGRFEGHIEVSLGFLPSVIVIAIATVSFVFAHIQCPICEH